MAAEITILNSLKDKLKDIKQIMGPNFIKQFLDRLDETKKELEEQVDGFGALNTDIVQAIYLAEDAIDTFRFGTAFQKQGVFHYKKDQFVKDIRKAVDDLRGKLLNKLDVQKSLKRFASNVQNPDKKSDSLDVEGRAKELAEFIVNPHSPFHIFVAEDSAEKSMLSMIYNTQDVKKHFPCRAHVRLTDDFGKEKILSDLLNQVTGSNGEKNFPLESSLQQELSKKTYLVVLLDVQAPDIWEIIKHAFPNSSNSRIIFSFQEADAARYPEIRFFGRELLRLKWEDTEFASTQSEKSGGNDIDNKIEIDWELDTRLGGAFKYLDKDDGNDIVGLKDKLNKLGQLTLKTSENHFLISVVGLAGAGKTTLVKTFFDNSFVKQQFKSRAWVDLHAFQDLEMRNVLMEILKQVSQVGEEEESTDLENLGTKLTQKLNEKRFLIVLDNVYALNVWYNLETIVSKNTNTSSRVILITRDAYLARCFGLSVALLKLDLLKEDDGWKLFLKKAKQDKSSEEDLEKFIRKPLWKKCCGLPLAICVLAGVLYSKKLNNISEWPQEMDKIMPAGEEKEDLKLQDMNADHSISEDVLSSLGKLDTSQIWALGYKDLPPHLKACLHYLSLFPKSYEIPVRRILQLWVAEGLVKKSSTDGEQTAPEDEVKKYFEELEARSMIEVAKRRLDGTAKTCRIPITLRDAFSPDAEEKGLFHIHRKSDSASTSKKLNIRRLAEHFDIKINPPDEKIEYLRSFISFKTRKSDKPAKEVSEFLNKTISKRLGFGLLRVLDLEGVYKPVLPELGKLPLLTYVGLRWTFLDEIPDSVGELSDLETLDVKHTNITTLPMSIWKAEKLRHLYMNEIHFDFPKKMSSGDSSPRNVQTLWGLLIGIKKPPGHWLESLKNLKKLGLTCHSKSIGDITVWIGGLSDLRTLRLRSVNDCSEPSNLELGSIEKLHHLTELYLLGKFLSGTKEIKLEEIRLPQSLKILTLSLSSIKDDPMPQLGELKNLNILRLLAHSYTGESMICKRENFPKLRVLKIWVLKELEEWKIEKGAMPVLSELEIRYCPNLEKTEGLENLSTLKELKLTNMKKEFVSKVKEIISEQQHIINEENLETHPPWD